VALILDQREKKKHQVLAFRVVLGAARGVASFSPLKYRKAVLHVYSEDFLLFVKEEGQALISKGLDIKLHWVC